jgi:hypothetical protein
MVLAAMTSCAGGARNLAVTRMKELSFYMAKIKMYCVELEYWNT